MKEGNTNSTANNSFGGGYETGDYERAMALQLCHCLPPGDGVDSAKS
jgi:hypothetical protein